MGRDDNMKRDLSYWSLELREDEINVIYNYRASLILCITLTFIRISR